MSGSRFAFGYWLLAFSQPCLARDKANHQKTNPLGNTSLRRNLLSSKGYKTGVQEECSLRLPFGDAKQRANGNSARTEHSIWKFTAMASRSASREPEHIPTIGMPPAGAYPVSAAVLLSR